MPSSPRSCSRRQVLRGGIWLWVAVGALFGGVRAGASADPQPPTEPLIVETWRGERIPFQVEIADTPEEREQGLQHRASLADGAGMLFDFKTDQLVTMWMKDTPIPLDMIFIGGDGVIRRIAVNTTPFSLTTIYSQEPVRAVLEVAGGTVAQNTIKVGDRVISPRLEGHGRP